MGFQPSTVLKSSPTLAYFLFSKRRFPKRFTKKTKKISTPQIASIAEACSACSCQFPKVPVLLLKQQQGEELIEFCRSGRRVTVHFTVKEDPKMRSLPRKLCQECAAIFSGIGVLYTVIQCFKVRVGAEAGVHILALFFWQNFLCFLSVTKCFLLGFPVSQFLFFIFKGGDSLKKWWPSFFVFKMDSL